MFSKIKNSLNVLLAFTLLFLSSFKEISLNTATLERIELKVVVANQSVITKFKTLSQAIEASRNFDASSQKEIRISEGFYYLSNTISLGPRDEGLTITGDNNSKTTLYGGQIIDSWKKQVGQFWVADLPKIKGQDWFFRTLIVDGKYAPRARFPEKGALEHNTKFNGKWMSTAQGGWKDKPTHKELTQINFKNGDITPDFETANAEITVLHHWDETLVGVQEVNFKDNILTTSIETGHPIGAFNSSEYIIWNTSRGMTKPGQWYIDKEKHQLVYWPLKNQNMNDVQVVIPTLKNVFKITDTKHIVIKNLSIQAANTAMKVGSFGAKLFDGAISLRNSNQCTFENLKISGVSGWGLKLFGENLTVEDCEIHNVGAGGIYIIGSNALIKNNYIHHVGKVYFSTIALYAGVTDPNVKEEWNFGKNKTNVVLSNNIIHDAPYVGIGIGVSNSVIEYNKISRVMQELADGSGIYATFCKNLTLKGNYVNELVSGKHGKVHAYYLDELSNNSTVEDNISEGVSSPFLTHMTSGNTIKNNIFMTKGPMTIRFLKSKESKFQNNLLISDTSFTLYRDNDIKVLENNIFDVPLGQVYESPSKNYSHIKTKLNLIDNNKIENSGFVFNGKKINTNKSSNLGEWIWNGMKTFNIEFESNKLLEN